MSDELLATVSQVQYATKLLVELGHNEKDFDYLAGMSRSYISYLIGELETALVNK